MRELNITFSFCLEERSLNSSFSVITPKSSVLATSVPLGGRTKLARQVLSVDCKRSLTVLKVAVWSTDFATVAILAGVGVSESDSDKDLGLSLEASELATVGVSTGTAAERGFREIDSPKVDGASVEGAASGK